MGKQRLKFISFIILMLIIWLPVLQLKMKFYKERPLTGAYTEPGEVPFSMASFLDNNYQKNTEEYLNVKFGFRSLLIRIKNTIDYSLWKESGVKDNITGSDGYIFSIGSIEHTIGAIYNGEDKNRSTIDLIKFFKDGLEENGTKLVVMMAPSKEAVIPNKMPYPYSKPYQSKTDYQDLIMGYKKNNIDCLDFVSYFRKIQDTTLFPLFTKTGFHWSTYGSSIAQDVMIDHISRILDTTLTQYERTGVEFSDTARFWDDDFEAAMNLLFKEGEKSYVYPKFKVVESSRNRFKPKVIIIGDSFFLGIKDLKMMPHIFSEDSRFWLYFTMASYSLDSDDGKPLQDINIMEELESADVVVLCGSMGTLNTFPFGVTKYYYNKSNEKSFRSEIKRFLQEETSAQLKQNDKQVSDNKSGKEKSIGEIASEINKNKSRVQLLAYNNMFVCADESKSDHIVADRKSAGTWETFNLFHLDDKRGFITSFKERLISAEPNAGFAAIANERVIKKEDVFEIIPLANDIIAIKSANGMYLSVDSKTLEVSANAKTVGEKEKFKLIRLK